MITNVLNEKKTDEEVYQMLKENRNEDFMDADEWKKLRLIELSKNGEVWSR